MSEWERRKSWWEKYADPDSVCFSLSEMGSHCWPEEWQEITYPFKRSLWLQGESRWKGSKVEGGRPVNEMLQLISEKWCSWLWPEAGAVEEVRDGKSLDIFWSKANGYLQIDWKRVLRERRVHDGYKVEQVSFVLFYLGWREEGEDPVLDVCILRWILNIQAEMSNKQ